MILAPRPPQIQYRTVPYVQSTYTVTVSTGEGLHCPVLYTFSKLTPATPILTVRRCAHTVGASVSTVCSVVCDADGGLRGSVAFVTRYASLIALFPHPGAALGRRFQTVPVITYPLEQVVPSSRTTCSFL